MDSLFTLVSDNPGNATLSSTKLDFDFLSTLEGDPQLNESQQNSDFQVEVDEFLKSLEPNSNSIQKEDHLDNEVSLQILRKEENGVNEQSLRLIDTTCEKSKLKMTIRKLKLKNLKQESQLAAYESNLAEKWTALECAKSELKSMKEKCHIFETENIALKTSVAQLEAQVNQYSHMKFEKDMFEEKFSALKSEVNQRELKIKRIKGTSAKYRKEVLQMRRTLQKRDQHIKNIWKMILNLGTNQKNAGLTAKEKTKLKKEYCDWFPSEIVENKGKVVDVIDNLDNLTTSLFKELTSSPDSEDVLKANQSINNEQLNYSIPTLLSPKDKVTSSDDSPSKIDPILQDKRLPNICNTKFLSLNSTSYPCSPDTLSHEDNENTSLKPTFTTSSLHQDATFTDILANVNEASSHVLNNIADYDINNQKEQSLVPLCDGLSKHIRPELHLKDIAFSNDSLGVSDPNPGEVSNSESLNEDLPFNFNEAADEQDVTREINLKEVTKNECVSIEPLIENLYLLEDSAKDLSRAIQQVSCFEKKASIDPSKPSEVVNKEKVTTNENLLVSDDLEATLKELQQLRRLFSIPKRPLSPFPPTPPKAELQTEMLNSEYDTKCYQAGSSSNLSNKKSKSLKENHVLKSLSNHSTLDKEISLPDSYEQADDSCFDANQSLDAVAKQIFKNSEDQLVENQFEVNEFESISLHEHIDSTISKCQSEPLKDMKCVGPKESAIKSDVAKTISNFQSTKKRKCTNNEQILNSSPVRKRGRTKLSKEVEIKSDFDQSQNSKNKEHTSQEVTFEEKHLNTTYNIEAKKQINLNGFVPVQTFVRSFSSQEPTSTNFVSTDNGKKLPTCIEDIISSIKNMHPDNNTKEKPNAVKISNSNVQCLYSEGKINNKFVEKDMIETSDQNEGNIHMSNTNINKFCDIKQIESENAFVCQENIPASKDSKTVVSEVISNIGNCPQFQKEGNHQKISSSKNNESAGEKRTSFPSTDIKCENKIVAIDSNKRSSSILHQKSSRSLAKSCGRKSKKGCITPKLNTKTKKRRMQKTPNINFASTSSNGKAFIPDAKAKCDSNLSVLNENNCLVFGTDETSSSKLHQSSLIPKSQRDLEKLKARKDKIKKRKEILKLQKILDKKFPFTENPLESFFRGFQNEQLCHDNLKHIVQSLVRLLINPSKFPNKATMLYHIFNYLNYTKTSPLLTGSLSEDQSAMLPFEERCIVVALFRIELKKIPYLNELLKTAVNTLHNIILSKDFQIYGMASLCRVFSEICKREGNSVRPVMLCAELLKTKHHFSSYLIASIAGVWKELFQIENNISVEEKLLHSSILYAAKKRPKRLNLVNWNSSMDIISKNFNAPPVNDTKSAMHILKNFIQSKCQSDSWNSKYMTSALTILAVYEDWEWVKENLLDNYILPNLHVFGKTTLNEVAFDLYCNLYADIYFVKPGVYSLDKELSNIYNYPEMWQGEFVKDSVALALIRLNFLKNKPLPSFLSSWFENNHQKTKVQENSAVFNRRLMLASRTVLQLEEIL